ncbi:MAG: hypothetical protein ACD_21C00032G0007 [uncultured bacterium]|nr:MAG: hypothetical protein ACD_21C00032G0007 [uncultured bacterium]
MERSTSNSFNPDISYPVNVVYRERNLSVASVSRLIANKKYKNGSKCDQSRQYLAQDVVQKMINKLLVEKQMSIKKLARVLAVGISDIEELNHSKETYLQLIGKINLPLIKLYCRTKWK